MDASYIEARRQLRRKQLVRDYLRWVRSDSSVGPACKPEDFLIWDCCRRHRQLRDRLGVLEHRAELLTCSSLSLRGDVFSPQWWRDFGKRFDIDVPAELIYG